MSRASGPELQRHWPRFPEGYSPGVAIVGCGDIVRQWHLTAYEKYGVRVVGAYDVNPEAIAIAARDHSIGVAFETLDELLADPGIEIVDIATHPAARIELVRRALEAGKHVLSQKPFALDMENARALVELANERGLRLAVNQNGRWNPPWRLSTLLIQDGAIGEPLAVTHLQDEPNSWLIGNPFDSVDQYVIFDGSIHWLDITRCWFGDKLPSFVQAREYRTPDQPAEAVQPWGALVDVGYADGSSAVLRATGCTNVQGSRSPFWIHGTEGTITGATSSPVVELTRDDGTTRYDLDLAWFPDGLGGTMGELMCSIAEDREPYNSARHNLVSLEMTLGACRSATEGGTHISLPLPPS
jgi:predicted dehydrogenase